jgi:hypothetical protein
MLRAMIAGEQNPTKLAALAGARLVASRETLAAALHGRVTRHHRFLLAEGCHRPRPTDPWCV